MSPSCLALLTLVFDGRFREGAAGSGLTSDLFPAFGEDMMALLRAGLVDGLPAGAPAEGITGWGTTAKGTRLCVLLTGVAELAT